MIVIKKPQIKTMDGKVRISAGIDIPEETYRMWVRRVSSLKNYKGYNDTGHWRGSNESQKAIVRN